MQHDIIVPHCELLTPKQMALADRLAPERGMAGAMLMDNAGRAVARALRRHTAPARTLVLCGPGNNGGDGYVVARLLAQSGWPVSLARLGPPRAGSDAEAAAALWHGPEVAFAPAEAARAGLVIDAVFGAGLAREVDGLVAATLKAARRLVAIDVPSGLDGATSAIRGFAPRAELTVTFFRLKPGHVLMPGRTLCGRLVLADIGLPAAVLPRIAPDTWLNQPGLWHLRAAAGSDHKYTKGHLTVLGGATMTGAARLAAGVARQGGAGLVTIAAPEGADRYRIGGDPGVIVSDAPLAELLQDDRRQAWVCGPGLGVEAARVVVPQLLAAGRRAVVDADALTAFAGEPERLRAAAVLTPHAGEFARLFGPPGDDRLGAARAAAARCGCVVLLKGPDTVVAAPDGRASINASAPPWLATAGAGDVLSGLIGALLAQGMEPWQAASAGAWLHGRAAARLGPGMVAEDLAPAVAAVVAETR